MCKITWPSSAPWSLCVCLHMAAPTPFTSAALSMAVPRATPGIFFWKYPVVMRLSLLRVHALCFMSVKEATCVESAVRSCSVVVKDLDSGLQLSRLQSQLLHCWLCNLGHGVHATSVLFTCHLAAACWCWPRGVDVWMKWIITAKTWRLSCAGHHFKCFSHLSTLM